ncbi:MAG: diaminopimelate epimerase [Prevotella sp.]|nr:diaminopimelate epimerase [Prevotella sp.]
MNRNIHFTKMQGAGNDYIYVNTLLYKIDNPADLSRRWSDRHCGIGSDGLVLIGAPTDNAMADFSMRIFNADGSEAMMCGNASRCVGKYVYERGLTDKTSLKLETLSGVKELNLHLDGKGKVESVTVNMGIPVWEHPRQFCSAVNLPVKGTFVSMGNPHYVVFVDNLREVCIEDSGPFLENHPAFPEGCNIEFAQFVAPGKLRMRVWERGSGITQACGTGACATAAAAARMRGGVGEKAQGFEVQMDGGTLFIESNPADGHVLMTGPAAFVFDGEIT